MVLSEIGSGSSQTSDSAYSPTSAPDHDTGSDTNSQQNQKYDTQTRRLVKGAIWVLGLYGAYRLLFA